MASSHASGPDDLDFGATLRGFAAGQTVLRRYKLTRLIGRGGMGVVWEALDTELDEAVALKFLPETLVADSAAIDDLKREVRRSRLLAHPNVVRIHGFETDGTLAAISMEVVHGQTLTALRVARENRVVTVAELEAWTRQICGALDYAHQKAKVVHRDLKPANVMVTAEGEVKILDFGIAASISESASRVSNRGTSGTLTYMSPQQLLGKTATPSDDFYALGATLYELLTGKPPFYQGAVETQVLNAVPERLTKRRAELEVSGEAIPAAWETTIAALLAKEPVARPQSGAAVLAMLEGKVGPALVAVPLLDDKTDETHKSHASHKPYLKKPLWLTFAAIAAIALGSVGYHYGVSVPEQKRQAELARLEEEKAQAASAAEKARIAAEQEKLRTESEKEARRKEALAAAADKARGGVLVRTTPSGAEVRVGALALEKSPLTLRDVRLGKYPVKVRLEGYEPSDTEVEVKENDFSEVTIALVRSTGIVMIDSEPSGLGYTLTGEVTKRGRTPGREEVPTGQYTVTVDKEGWASQEQLLTVVRKDRVASLAEFLPGKVIITSSPAGAAVKNVAGQALGVTPLTLPEVQPGSVSYTLSLKGYQAAAVKGEAKARKAVELGAILEKQAGPQPGQPHEIPDLGMKFVPVAGTEVLFSIWDVRVQDFEAFVKETGLDATGGMWSFRKGQGGYHGDTWKSPGFAQWPTSPVVGVSWEDAKAFCGWLTKREQAAGRLTSSQEYRLPLDWEWSVAVGLNESRSGTPQSKEGKIDNEFPWGAAWPPPRGAGNYASSLGVDQYEGTSPVGSFAANRFGLYDMGGNVCQWCEDHYNDSGTWRVLRGASFYGGDRTLLLSSRRGLYTPDGRFDYFGFRVVCAAGVSDATAKSASVASDVKPPVPTQVYSTVPQPGEKWTIPDINLTLVPIASGTFIMGSNDEQDQGAQPEHPVTLTKRYWLGQYDVTVGQYKAFVNATHYRTEAEGDDGIFVRTETTWEKRAGTSWRNPDLTQTDEHPVVGVSWNDANEFCAWLTKTERAAGRLPEGYDYTLPTEAQWEYACRAGSTGAYAGNLDSMGWYAGNSGKTTHPVGQKKANAWGLFDMHGNVWQWCRDLYGAYGSSSQVDPTGAASGSDRVGRGGGWNFSAQNCRSANRLGYAPGARVNFLGFRLALSSVSASSVGPTSADKTPALETERVYSMPIAASVKPSKNFVPGSLNVKIIVDGVAHEMKQVSGGSNMYSYEYNYGASRNRTWLDYYLTYDYLDKNGKRCEEFTPIMKIRLTVL